MEIRPNNLINLNDPLMMALKAINSISGKSLTEADLKRHRAAMERAGRLTAPTGDVEVTAFNLGDMDCESLRPEFAHDPNHVILYAHGGGFICGGLAYARILGAKLAMATGFTTFSFSYRLAPEDPYPAALEDGMQLWEHLLSQGFSPDHIIMAGDSAGGNLVLCMTQKLLSEKRELPEGLILFSPWTDMTATASSYEINKEKDPILTAEYVSGAANAYIGGAGDPSDPRFSPLFGDLSGFPPTFIMAGRNEILLDDSISLKDRICEAGGKAELDIDESGWHVYQQMPIPLARRSMKRLSQYVSEQIYGKR